ncbi:chemotaxis protein CheW [Clostridium aestuarii]|uniref:Chemotaxis protein CheW n=1 Tax=Clostridium aestuarii TaxID=338193 RepID=A0ABT4D137_9CLOT|nr:chemotaxis protein CheW [Clostridium aestuarii]MCY6484812.1 chemotaxis protein CheW [Clostridium aestuarii]
MDEDTLRGKYLIFSIDKEEYGMKIKYVIEIIGIQPITTVPELPNYIKGIVNLRGNIIPVMDIRIRFKKQERQYDDRTCIVVVNVNDILIGLVVDRVLEVVNIPEDKIALPPDVKSGYKNEYISGIGKTEGKVKLLLDCKRLIDYEGD